MFSGIDEPNQVKKIRFTVCYDCHHSDRIGLTFKQVTDENLYSGLTEMYELPEQEEGGGGEHTGPTINT